MNRGIYGIVSKSFELQTQLKYLENAYSEMPSSLNCVGCGKCCQVQHPNCYYIEFINMIWYIEKNWTDRQRAMLQYKCAENYLSNSTNKECVFLNEDMSCSVYEVRDYNCRAFGIIPKKTYADRVKKKNKEFKKSLLLQKQTDCCEDIKPSRPISDNKLDDIFEKIYSIDKNIGIPQDDLLGADNYLTFHDHYMVHMYHDNTNILQALTAMKESDDNDKKEFLKYLYKNLGLEDEPEK